MDGLQIDYCDDYIDSKAREDSKGTRINQEEIAAGRNRKSRTYMCPNGQRDKEMGHHEGGSLWVYITKG